MRVPYSGTRPEFYTVQSSVPFLKFLFMWELHVESAAAEAFDGFEDVVS